VDFVATYDRSLCERRDALKVRFLARDRRAAEVRAVRHGNFDMIAPDAFSEDWPRPIVANMIDTYARHASAALSPLPQVSCQSASMKSDAAKSFAEKRTRIANHYFKRSRMRVQMQQGADQFYTYGLIVAQVAPDFREQFPDVYVKDSIGVYPVWDGKGRTVEVLHEFDRYVIELAAEYPALKQDLLNRSLGIHGQGATRSVRVAVHDDGKFITMFCPDLGGLVLSRMANPLGRCTYVAVKKPGLDAEIHGTFDDLIWVQIARHALQMLVLQGADEAINAPIAVPQDVTDVPTGPGAVIRSNSPQAIGRVNLDVPAEAWRATDHLKSEMQVGAITPEALGGSIDASVVTGRGVQELMAGYSQQVAMCQEALVGFYEQLLDLCFDMDEKLWPDVEKTINGVSEGAPYRLKYTPSKDVDGDRTVDVTYGGVQGLDPNRALIYLLQLQGGGLVSKAYVRRNTSNDINSAEEESQITLEAVRDALIQGLSATGQSMAGMIAQGQDPAELLAKLAEAAKQVQKGKPIEDIVSGLFPPPEPVEPAPGSPESAGAPGPGGPAFDAFAPQPGADATAGPGGRPSLQQLFAGIGNGGQAQLSGGISRMGPAA